MRKRLAAEKGHHEQDSSATKVRKSSREQKPENIGRAIDPATGKHLFEKFSYPTFYVSDTHHLALKDVNSKSEFIVLPNKPEPSHVSKKHL